MVKNGGFSLLKNYLLHLSNILFFFFMGMWQLLLFNFGSTTFSKAHILKWYDKYYLIIAVQWLLTIDFAKYQNISYI